MTITFPLPRSTRETPIIVGDGRATYGPFGFSIFDEADVVADVKRGTPDFVEEAVIVSKVSGHFFDNFVVTFAPPLLGGHQAIVRSRRLHERSSDVMRGGSVSGTGLDRELSKVATVLQELWRDIRTFLSGLRTEGAERRAADATLTAAIGNEEAARIAQDAADRQFAADAVASEAAQRLQADATLTAGLVEAQGLLPMARTYAEASEAAATQAGVYAAQIGAALFDFSFDSNPATPGYDWSV